MSFAHRNIESTKFVVKSIYDANGEKQEISVKGEKNEMDVVMIDAGSVAKLGESFDTLKYVIL